MGEARYTLGGPKGTQRVGLFSLKPHAVATGGPPEGHHRREVGKGRVKVKLHAVAPGGPPEGQCEK